uniref:Saposin B-type domain-containing protein n=1 Tax=Sinocyclocheilus rhinocerous TaxID=307959 RepID=A0A673LZ13_9TELE
MLQSIILITLLISSGKISTDQLAIFINQFVYILSGETQTKQQPGMCWACKWSMKKLKKQISNGATPDDIKKKLEMVCDEIGFLKSLCRKFVNKYKDTLVEELSTTEDTETICINIGVCKK